MARNERSRIDFNINIKGAKDAKTLTQILPKLIKQFDQLAAAMAKVEKQKGVSGRSSTTKADVSDRISRIELGVRKGDINNVQTLTANYASLVNQIKALERQGKKTGAIQLRAHKMHRRLTDVIDKRTEETRQLRRAELDAAGSTDKLRGSLLNQIGSIELSTKTLAQAGREVTRQAGAAKNASFVLLNAGYLIQDSPYGVRGMANNVSQLAQAYQNLSLRVQYLNETQNANLTVEKSLIGLLKGSTGLILLIGSVMPAALEVITMNWDKWTAGMGESKKELERNLDLLLEVIDAEISLSKIGEDPVGLRASQLRAESLKEERDQFQELVDLREEQDRISARVSSLAMFGGAGSDEIVKSIKRFQELSEEVRVLREELGIKAERDPNALKEKIDNIDASIRQLQEGIKGTPIELKQNITQTVERQIESLELYSSEFSEGTEDALSRVRRSSQIFINGWIDGLNRSIAEGTRESRQRARIFLDAIRELKGALDEETEDVTEDDSVFDRSAILDLRQKAISATNAIAEASAERRIDAARTTNEKIEALREAHGIRIRELLRKNKAGEFETVQEYYLARKNEVDKFLDAWMGLTDRQKVFELDMQATLMEQGLDNPSDFDEHLSNLNSYFDKRREIIIASTKDEIEQKRQLLQVDIEQNQRILQAERQKQERKRQLVSNYSTFAITSAQALGQALNSSARSQFQVQKVASASQAIINGYLAYTKTLAQGGLFAKPLAVSALLLSFAQAGKIMSQSFDNARATGGGGTAAGRVISYRGFNFEENQTNAFSQSTPFTGSQSVSRISSQPGQQFPDKVQMEITDGFDNMVAKGTLDLRKKNNQDLGLWK